MKNSIKDERVDHMFNFMKDKYIRVWDKNHTDEECFFEKLVDWYVLPNKDVMLLFSEDNKYFSYQLLSEITFAFSKKDNE